MTFIKDPAVEQKDPDQATRESGELKQALKKLPATTQLAEEADEWPQEAQEAIEDVRKGHDSCEPGSWVAETIEQEDEGSGHG